MQFRIVILKDLILLPAVALVVFLMSATAFAAEKMNCDPDSGLIDGACFAQKREPAGGENKCKDDGTQQDMNVCAGLNFEKAERALNEAYKSVLAKSSKTDQKVLRQKQRDWNQKRARDCREFAKPYEGGSMHAFEYSGCMKEATDRRAAELMVSMPRK